MEHDFIDVGEVTLHVVLDGPVDGPPVVLLHGFPEFWYGWRKQIPALAAAGYRVIAPDQRGYNLSDKPRGRRAYRMERLAGDVLGLITALGYEQVYLAGHDWGGIVAWWLAAQYPEKLRKLAILNAPYPINLADYSWRQRQRSWYVLFFQLPFVAELGFRIGSGSRWNMLSLSGRTDTFSEAELAQYRAAWQRPGALTAMLHWYRAALPAMNRTPTPAAGSLAVPTLMLWGEQDIALGRELAEASLGLCANGEVTWFPEASHWLQLDEPAAVNEQLIAFFR